MQIEQMFLVGFDGCEMSRDHWLAEAVAQGVGGVILFDRNVDGKVQNISSPDQLQELTASLQERAPERLLIAVDQEGGMVSRLKQQDGFPATVSAASLGAYSPDTSTLPAAREMAVTLARCGINWNLAPVVDLDLQPDNPIISRFERSFGHGVEDVVSHAEVFIKAHHEQNIACCLKHFPGHGSSRGDSHLGFVDSTNDWQPVELEPYERLFARGFGDAVMTAHIVQRGLDNSGLPATLSPVVVKGMLREQLGFSGVTITDDLQMRAIADHYGFQEAVQRAVLAGVDLLIIGNNLERRGNVVDRGVAAVRGLLDQGKITEEFLGAAIARIRLLKKKTAGLFPW